MPPSRHPAAGELLRRPRRPVAGPRRLAVVAPGRRSWFASIVLRFAALLVVFGSGGPPGLLAPADGEATVEGGTWPAAAWAQPTHRGEARASSSGAVRLYKEGVRLYERSDYRAAIAAFESSLRQGAHANALYNIGECYERLGELERAVEYYERYIAAPGSSDHLNVRTRLAGLRQRPSRLRVQSEPRGAWVYIDQAVTPLRTPVEIEVAPGKHAVAVVLEGYQRSQREIEAAFGRPLTLDVSLRPLPPSLGSLRVDADVDGVEVSIDGLAAGRAPLILELAPGPHRLAAQKRGFRAEEQVVTVQGGQMAAVRLTLRPASDSSRDAGGGDGARRAQTTAAPPRNWRIGFFGAVAFPKFGKVTTDGAQVSIPTAAAEFGLRVGHSFGRSKLGIDADLVVAASPLSYTNYDQRASPVERQAWFIALALAPSLRVRLLPWLRLNVGVGLGVSLLAGADKWFFPFESAERRILDGSGSALVNDVSGTFAAFLVRPEVNLTFHLYQGLSATLALFAMDYSPAFSDFVNDSVRYVIRYQVGGGFGYEF